MAPFKGPHNDMKQSSWNSDGIVYSHRLENSKIHMPFLMFIGYQKYRINEKNIGERCFGVPILFEPNLDNLQPVTTPLSTAGDLIKVSN